MFGYLRPFNDELKYKYIKEYKWHYCSICNGLRRKFGLFYSTFLNYEIVFLYLLIDGVIVDASTQKYDVRCPINPFYRFQRNINAELLDYVCFLNYYFALRKIEDNYRDEKKLRYRILYKFLASRKKYIEKCEEYFLIKKTLDNELEIFYSLENNFETHFDELALSMGRVLEHIVKYYLSKENVSIGPNQKQIEKISLHLGEWIYLIDALEDYNEDLSRKRFNPLFARKKGEEKDGNKKLGFIVANMMARNIELMSSDTRFYSHESILKNILEVSLKENLKRVCQKECDNCERENTNGCGG